MQGVTLDTIGSGALGELFQVELNRVLANIADPNTVAMTKRSIEIKVTFKTRSDREVADVELTCASKLAPVAKVSTQVFMGRQNGKFVAVENDPRQGNFFDQAKPQLVASGTVAEFPKGSE